MSTVKRKKRRKRRHFGSLYFLLSILIIGVMIFVAASVFFKVSKIETRGFSRYTDLQVREAAGITEGGSLFFVNSNKAVHNMFDKLPYLDTVRITPKIPDTIIIEGTECIPAASVAGSGYYWLIDKKGKILENISSETAKKYTAISGLNVLAPYAGSIIEVSEDEEDKKAGLVFILEELTKNGIMSDVSEINVEKSYNITFKYLERFEVKIGVREDIDYKISVLKAVIPQLATNERGTIDLSDPKTGARFMPEQTAVITAAAD